MSCTGAVCGSSDEDRVKSLQGKHLHRRNLKRGKRNAAAASASPGYVAVEGTTMRALLARREAVYADRESRVEARMLSGCRCCLAGLDNFSFPASYMIKDALRDEHWVKHVQEVNIAADESIIGSDKDTGIAIVRLNKLATCILFSNNERAPPDDPIGLHGGVVTVLFTPVEGEVFQTISCADVDGIDTPPTPPPRFH